MNKIGEFELNKIYCMDCLEALPKIPNNSIDLILTDPPYNTGMDSKVTSSENHPTVRFNSNKLTKKPWLFGFFNDNYTEDEYLNLVQNVSKELFRVLKQDRAGYVFINWKSLGLWLVELAKVGFNIKNVIVWDKVVHGLNYQNYAYTYELIIYFVKGKFSPNNKWKNYYKDVWHIQRKIDNSQEDGHHETVKHDEVIRQPILLACKMGWIVLDPFGGSGKTAEICKQNGRNSLTFEINPEYVNIANKRLAQEVLPI